MFRSQAGTASSHNLISSAENARNNKHVLPLGSEEECKKRVMQQSYWDVLLITANNLLSTLTLRGDGHIRIHSQLVQMSVETEGLLLTILSSS